MKDLSSQVKGGITCRRPESYSVYSIARNRGDYFGGPGGTASDHFITNPLCAVCDHPEIICKFRKEQTFCVHLRYTSGDVKHFYTLDVCTAPEDLVFFVGE
jgi:hypothetical protein